MVALKVPSHAAAAGRAVDDILAGAVIIVRIFVAYLAAEVAQAHEVEVRRGYVERGRLRAIERVLRNTSGPITAEPKLRKTPPSSCDTL